MSTKIILILHQIEKYKFSLKFEFTFISEHVLKNIFDKNLR